jgi:hypothetical protein
MDLVSMFSAFLFMTADPAKPAPSTSIAALVSTLQASRQTIASARSSILPVVSLQTGQPHRHLQKALRTLW